MSNLLSTFTCARITGLSIQTIIRAIDKGILKGFRIPGSKHRRITKESLLEYMMDNKIPVGQDDYLMLTE